MNDQRKLEIAMKMLKYVLRKQGLHLTENFGRELGNASKAMQIPAAELKEFFQPIVQEFVDELFNK